MIEFKNINVLTLGPHYKMFIKESVEAIAKDVNSVEVFVHHNYLAEISNFIPINGYFSYIRNFTKDKLYDNQPTSENVKVHLVSMIYLIPDGRNKNLGEKIFEKINTKINDKKIHFDLIHAHFTWPYGYVASKLGKIYGIPTIITVHENKDLLIKEIKSKNDHIFWAWKNADALIRVNRTDIPLLKEFNENIFYVPNGFNPKKLFASEKEVARKEMELPINKKIIFGLGILTERKGFQYLIEAMNEITKIRSDVYCIIGGNGPMRQKLNRKIKKFGLENHIKLIGYIKDNVLRQYYNCADVFVLPSLSEGNPTVMFEALGAGLPFVGTKVGGIPEIINSEDYGLLCEPSNSKDLAEKILIAIDKKWKKEKILEYAGSFTWNNIAEELLKVYTNILEK